MHAVGGVVYHDITERKWADKALEHGVDGLICVNDRAGGHAGTRSPDELLSELGGLGVPLVCAGGIGAPEQCAEVIERGYAGVQLGTRFIATVECTAHGNYKQAILDAKAADIVLTDLITGVPVSVIRTALVEKLGTRAGPLARLLLKNNRTKHWVRTAYAVKSLIQLKKGVKRGLSYRDYFQAGKSVETIDEVRTVAEVMGELAAALRARGESRPLAG